MHPESVSTPVVLLALPARTDRIYARSILDRAGIQTLEASNYRELVIELAKSGADVIVCDEHLPGGSWKDVLGQIAWLSEPPKLIVAAGEVCVPLWAEVLNLGAFDVLMKPFEPGELLQVALSACPHTHAVPAKRPASHERAAAHAAA